MEVNTVPSMRRTATREPEKEVTMGVFPKDGILVVTTVWLEQAMQGAHAGT